MQFSLADFLCYKQSDEKNLNQLIQNEKDQEFNSTCTFKPQINQNYLPKQQSKDNEQQSPFWYIYPTHKTRKLPSDQKKNPIERCKMLHSLAKPISQKKDRTKLEIEYEKFCDECTFMPYVTQHKPSLQSSTQNNNASVKNEEKSIQRLQKARVEK